MFRRFALLLAAALLLTQTALAGEAANYEISSYVLYMTVQEDGGVRMREELIYSNPSAYQGFSLTVDLDGAETFSDVAVWCDGEALDEVPAAEARIGEGRGFSVTRSDGRALIDILISGDSDSHAFACAYTLGGLADRYEDTALLERVLIPANREVMLQNAVAIVTLPQWDGDVLAYVDGAPEEIPVLIKYDTVNIGPIDVAADEQLSMQLLFPQEWLSEAEVTPVRMRESVVASRRQAEAETEREVNQRRAEQYTAVAVYGAVFLAALFILMKKYGVKKSRVKAGFDEALLKKYPAAFSVYAALDKSGPGALTATLGDLADRGVVSIERAGKDSARIRLESRPKELLPHEEAALNIVFPNGAVEWVDVSALYTAGNEAQADRLTDGFAAYDKAVAADAHAAGLTWKNDTILILTALFNILCGVILGFVLLLVGKRMILEACVVAAFMFVMINQINRVRTLTDEGERLQRSAYALEDDKTALNRHASLAAGVGAWDRTEPETEEAALYGDLYHRLGDIYYGAAQLRRTRKKK